MTKDLSLHDETCTSPPTLAAKAWHWYPTTYASLNA